MNKLTKIDARRTASTSRGWSGSGWPRCPCRARSRWRPSPLALIAGVALFETRGAPVAAVPPAADRHRGFAVVAADRRVGRLCRPLRGEQQRRVAAACLGEVTAIHFSDGAVVRNGQLLFTIDPRPFLAALAEARAAVHGARSDLAGAGRLGRAQRLVAADAVSRSDVDRLRCARPGGPGRARRRPGAGPAASPRCRVHPGPRADLAAAFRIAASMPATSSQGGGSGADGHAADDDQRARPDLLHLRRLGGACSSRPSARARPARRQPRSKSACRTRPTIAGTGRLDFTDNGLDQRSGTIRLPRRARQSGPVPDARHVRQHAPVERRQGAGAAGARHRGPDRPGAQDRAGRRAKDGSVCGQAGRCSGRWSTACASSAPA